MVVQLVTNQTSYEQFFQLLLSENGERIYVSIENNLLPEVRKSFAGVYAKLRILLTVQLFARHESTCGSHAAQETGR